MAYPGECPSFRDPELSRIRAHLDELSPELLMDPKNAEYQRALIARFDMFIIVALESLWSGARKCPGGLPQKTKFEELNDKPDQANFAQYSLLVLDGVSYILELQEKTILPFFISKGIVELKEIITALESIHPLISKLKSDTALFLTSPVSFDPPAYQARVGQLLQPLLPILGRKIDIIGVEPIELALSIEDRKLINNTVLDSWSEQDASAFKPLWASNSKGGTDFPSRGNWTKSTITAVFGKHKYTKCWKFSRYPGKLGGDLTSGIGGFFSAQAIMGGGGTRQV